jgi:excinuclease Cho
MSCQKWHWQRLPGALGWRALSRITMPVKVTSTGLYVIPRRRAQAQDHRLPSADLEALPGAPGVYIFRDARRRPLYIGKSINIRQRVATHLRDGEQAEMLTCARRVEAIETAGELGALLQEMALIRSLQPPFNSLLRSIDEPWVLAGRRGALEIGIMRADDAKASGLIAWGAFASHERARAALSGLLRKARLCPGLSGLESIHPQRGCFASQLGHCGGACRGGEALATYRRRRSKALNALQASNWPYAGPIGIVEERPGLRQVLVIDGWSYRGLLDAAGRPALPKGSFDPDLYRLLGRPLAAGVLSVIHLQG